MQQAGPAEEVPAVCLDPVETELAQPDVDEIEQMEEPLTRWRASPAVLSNLEGVLTPGEIRGYARVLLPTEDI